MIITHELFEQLQVIERAEKRKEFKEKVMDVVATKLGRIYRTSKKVSSVIDEIIYKASDRGYSFNGRETLAKKKETSLSTVDRAIKRLKETGEVIVAYRENPNGNSVKTPVIIFKKHHNFEQIKRLLELDEKEADKQDDKEESAQIPCTPTDSEEKQAPTFNLPSNTNNVLKERNDDENLDHSFVNDSVPKQFVREVKPFFNNAKDIEEYWKMAVIASKDYDLDNATLTEKAIESFKQTINALKRNAVKKNTFAHFFGTVKNKLEEVYFELLHDAGFEANDFNVVVDPAANWFMNNFENKTLME